MGICLGAQLIAAALGADVFKGEQGFERGWLTIDATGDGLATPARHLDAQHTHLLQWHQDTFTFPEGAKLLASSAQYEYQIFSYGTAMMAIQSHPEILPEQLEEWSQSPIDEQERIDMLNGAAEHMPSMDKQFRLFMTDWLKDVVLES